MEKLKKNIKVTRARTVNRCLTMEHVAIDLLEEALNELDKQEKRTKGKNDHKM